MGISTGDATVERSDDRLTARARRVDPTAVDAVLRDGQRPLVRWVSGDGAVVAGSGVAARITATGPDRFAAVERRAVELFADVGLDAVPSAARPRLFGGFAFHDDHRAAPPWSGYPSAAFVLPSTQVVSTDDGTWLTRTGGDPSVAEADDAWCPSVGGSASDSAGPPGVEARQLVPDRAAWESGVTAALDRIEDGELTKVVLAGSLEVTLARSADPVAVLGRLDEAYPSCHRFLFQPVDGPAFVGATPERLVALRGREVETDALAGSTGRGETDDEDAWLASELQHSAKNAHEHAVAVEAIREQLAPLAASVTTGERTVRKLATVQHLHTPVRATLGADRHVLDLVDALHPTPAVGGLPPDAALETIRAVEPFDRGWYAAPVGWIDPAGNGTFTVAIRSATIADRRATLFAGAGIVADSDPASEWDEVQLKYRPILDALDG